ncbi:alcohol dehydrogenase catalytic domain-containing protein [Mesorhizobium sp. CGMCC 1.15528]|uniref:alcohol dehydrogenase n=1 Tax=Mesorhizobium zhangyense TaxID=1776730 RepID=A0A7C9R9J6_9HYPH|nr:alcohol dehydrogenase catalytic domain-containing protein [Mesorhizobium zhangyense]NGN43562.1 alcohol dehydrogenase catalytic domain-containing protein [Mesorhizobium zhangyense]
MKAVLLKEFGGPEVLTCTEVAKPTAKPNEVIVQVAFCGVCHLDLILRQDIRSRLTLPRVLGHELAGKVVEVGEAVTGFATGDRVASSNFQACGKCHYCLIGRASLCRQSGGDIGQTRDGGYAEFVALPAENLVRIPKQLPLEHAALAACVYGPPYKALLRSCRLKAGESVIVTGASGGLGIAALQIAEKVGARSIAITSNALKVDSLKSVGAADVIVSEDGNFGQQVRDLTDGRGADVAIELVGSPTFGGTLRGLAPGGRCAVVGELHGKPIEINLGLLVLKEWEFHGVQSASTPELAEVLAFMVDAGIEPQIDKVLGLEQIAEAHRSLSNRQTTGRLLLRP